MHALIQIFMITIIVILPILKLIGLLGLSWLAVGLLFALGVGLAIIEETLRG